MNTYQKINAKWENEKTRKHANPAKAQQFFELQFLCASAAPASLYLTFVVAVVAAVVVLLLLLLLLLLVVVCGQPSNHTFLALSVQNNLSISPIQQQQHRHHHHHPTPHSTKRDGNCCCCNCSSSDGSNISPGRMSGNIYHLHAYIYTYIILIHNAAQNNRTFDWSIGRVQVSQRMVGLIIM